MVPGRAEYERARAWMTDEVVAVCETLIAHGVEEIVVSDSHGNGLNILIEKLPSAVQLVRSWPRPLGMVQGIEKGNYAGAMFIGYHGGSTSHSGVLAHTLSSNLHEVRLNGRVVSETGLYAAVAGAFDVPVIMVSGDEAYTAEAGILLEGVETVTTKSVIGMSSVMTVTPDVARSRLREGAVRALERIGECKPHVVEGPVALEVAFVVRLHAEVMAMWPGVERISSHEIRIHARDMVEVSRLLTFITSYDPNRKAH